MKDYTSFAIVGIPDFPKLKNNVVCIREAKKTAGYGTIHRGIDR